MKLEQVKRKDLKLFFKYYKEDFPLCERRTYSEFLQCLKDKRFSANFVFDDDKLVGYICYWKLDGFAFVEHVAILPLFRGGGYGSKLMRFIIKSLDCDVVLEVEPPLAENQKRRVKFYEKLGFMLTAYRYFQPPYHHKTEQIEMKIMTTDKNYSAEKFSLQTAQIREVVYRGK